ncbi:MAG: DNA-binding protein [Sphingomonadales bacterium]|nr:MAG: DNA-binding protein [Sphingomonadales bacterium]
MSQGYQRMLPRLSDENRFYWTSGADGVLRMLRCGDCTQWVHPPQPVCSKCLSRNLSPAALSGTGEIFSLTLNYKAWGPGLDVPYAIAVVKLDEQSDLKLTTNIVGIAPEAAYIGMRVRVVFEQDEDVWLPMFTPEVAAQVA